MSLKVKYREIMNTLKSKMENLKDGEGNPLFKLVMFGEKAEITDFEDNYPVCLITPSLDVIRDRSTTQLQHELTVDLVILTRNRDYSQGVIDTLDLIGEVYDSLSADRSLGNVVSTLFFVSNEIVYSVTPRLLEVFAGIVRLRLLFYLTSIVP